MHALQIRVSGLTGTEGFDIQDAEWARLRDGAAGFEVTGDKWSMLLVARDEDQPGPWGECGFGDAIAEVFPALMKIRRTIVAGASFGITVVLSDKEKSLSLDSGFLTMCTALGTHLSLRRELSCDSEAPHKDS